MKKKLYIYNTSNFVSDNKPDYTYMTFDQIVLLAKSKNFVKHVGKYKSLTFYCHSFTSIPRPFLTSIICRLMTFGKCNWIDLNGNLKHINLFELIRLFRMFIHESITYPRVLEWIENDIDSLMMFKNDKTQLYKTGSPVYLCCGLFYGHIAGGSIAHIAGVANQIGNLFAKPAIFISTGAIPTVCKKLDIRIINDPIPYSNIRDIIRLTYNEAIFNYICNTLRESHVSIIYQRSTLSAYAGIKYAMKNNLPFILEYNGSEVWASKQWENKKLKGIRISEKVELLTFEKADLITCVSTPLKNQLIELGIDKSKILVNPNAVDAETYHPELDGSFVRSIYNIDKDIVIIGFIGTFGPWHGAEVLANAFVNAAGKTGKKIHLMLIGDGTRLPSVRGIIKKAKLENQCTFAGIIPQQKGPSYLAACDILVSPQVRNQDGTPFFGSPTKLFEYMAMGKAIIASNMDQLAEVLTHEKTALLCEPANVEQMTACILRLLNDKNLRDLLGKNAREEVCKKYTWEKHTEKIILALEEVLKHEN